MFASSFFLLLKEKPGSATCTTFLCRAQSNIPKNGIEALP